MSVAVKSSTALDFGPPRRVFSLDAMDAEFERQETLLAAGYLRRRGGRGWEGMTYGWQQSSDGKWYWSGKGVYLESKHTAFEDHERAWEERHPIDEVI